MEIIFLKFSKVFKFNEQSVFGLKQHDATKLKIDGKKPRVDPNY